MRSDELFAFVMSRVSGKQHIFQPFEDTLSVTSQRSIFHELECVGTGYKVLQDSGEALKAQSWELTGASQIGAARREGVRGWMCTRL